MIEVIKITKVNFCKSFQTGFKLQKYYKHYDMPLALGSETCAKLGALISLDDHNILRIVFTYFSKIF